MTKPLKNQLGVSLVEALVAVAIFSIMMMAYAHMYSAMADGQRHINRKNEIFNLQSSLRTRVLQDSFCRCNFGSGSRSRLSFRRGSPPNRVNLSLYERNPNNCRREGAMAVPGQDLGSGLIIDQVQFRDIQFLGSGKYSANLFVEFRRPPRRSDTNDILLKPIEVSGVILSSTQAGGRDQIASCSSNQIQAFTQMRFYRNPGRYNFTVPAEVNQLIIEAWGAGGGGGGSKEFSQNGGDAGGGGGGGGGAYVRAVVVVTPGQTYRIDVGTGGQGGRGAPRSRNGEDGTDGGDTRFRNHGIDIIARGGRHGRGSKYTRWSEFGYAGIGGGKGSIPNVCNGCLSNFALLGQNGAQGAYNYTSDSYAEGGQGGGAPRGGLGGQHNQRGSGIGGGGGGGTKSNESGINYHDGGDGSHGALLIHF